MGAGRDGARIPGMSTRPLVRLVLLTVAALASGAGAARAADVTVLCSNGLRAVMEELGPRFQRATGHNLVVTYGLAAALRTRVEAGERFDLVVLTPPLLDELVAKGHVAGDARGVIARSGLGIFTRTGQPRRDVATTAAFTRALLDAASLAYAREGASGVYFAGLVQKLGIADRLASKTVLAANGEEVGERVAHGDAELGILPLSEILPVRGVELVGLFPADVQNYVVMAGGVSARAADARAARALLDYLMAADALPVITAKGMSR